MPRSHVEGSVTMSAEIVVRTEILATHYWPGASGQREYLGHPHAHVFKFTALAPVSHSDRDIEFHDLRDRLDQVVREITNHKEGGLMTFGGLSCESIGEMILTLIPQLSQITVSEDGQCDAIVRKDADHARPPVITVCGSTRFRDEYEEAHDTLEKEGWAVLSVGSFPGPKKEEMPKDMQAKLDDLHKQKIRMSDAIYVVNPGGYIGSSTRSEIALARKLGKAILSREPLKEDE